MLSQRQVTETPLEAATSVVQKAAAFTLTPRSTEQLIEESRKRLAERRAAREQAPVETSVGGFTIERRLAAVDRRKVDRRGAVTVEIDGHVVIRPRPDLARFDPLPADVSAFTLLDELRS